MSKILDMAKGFNEQSKKQANAIEQQLKQDFKKHEARIQAALNESEQRIESDIHDYKQHMMSLFSNVWTSIIVVSVLVFIIVLSGIILWQVNTITQNQKELTNQEFTLENLNSRTWGIRLVQEEEVRYIELPEGITVEKGWIFDNSQKELIKLVEK